MAKSDALLPQILNHPQSQELKIIIGPINADSTICSRILQDLNNGKAESQTISGIKIGDIHDTRCQVKNKTFPTQPPKKTFHRR
jgi:hypothetical protein